MKIDSDYLGFFLFFDGDNGDEQFEWFINESGDEQFERFINENVTQSMLKQAWNETCHSWIGSGGDDAATEWQQLWKKNHIDAEFWRTVFQAGNIDDELLLKFTTAECEVKSLQMEEEMAFDGSSKRWGDFLFFFLFFTNNRNSMDW